MNRWLGLVAAGAVVCWAANSALAQNDNPGGPGGPPGGPGGSGGPGGPGGPGPMNFDPAQMQQMFLERYRQTIEVTDNDEWAAIKPLVQKVMEARMAGFAGMGRGMMMGGPGRGGPGGGANAQAGPGGGRAGMFGQTMPEAEALQKAIDAKASKAEIKAALDKFVAARQAKQNELLKAQDSLRKVLTARQEAIATLNGLL
jgi:Spy/CpxP family protein refolding chaperone